MADDCASERCCPARRERGRDGLGSYGARAVRASGARLSRGARGAGAAGPPGRSLLPGSARGIPLPAAGRNAMRATTREAARAAARCSPALVPGDRCQCEGCVGGAEPR